MNFIRKNLSNILFVLFVLFLFSPYGLPVRALLIKGVSMVTTQLFGLEIDEKERLSVTNKKWLLQDFNGNTVDFNDLQGKVVLLNYWATWCPPCIAEMPGMQDLYNQYGDRVTFLFVAHDEPERVRGFIEKNSYTFPVYFEMSSAPQELGSNSLPTTYVIDSKGRIAVEKVGAADWNSKKVRNLLEDLLE